MLIGEISDSSLINFLSEYFSVDHIKPGDDGKQCVVLRNCTPSHSMQMILNDKEYIKDVIYLEGSP